jgi:hypothetical protein
VVNFLFCGSHRFQSRNFHFPDNFSTRDSIEVVIRFRPASVDAKSGTITILSNDRAAPHKLAV